MPNLASAPRNSWATISMPLNSCSLPRASSSARSRLSAVGKKLLEQILARAKHGVVDLAAGALLVVLELGDGAQPLVLEARGHVLLGLGELLGSRRTLGRLGGRSASAAVSLGCLAHAAPFLWRLRHGRVPGVASGP
jgi:hypothetical protein